MLWLRKNPKDPLAWLASGGVFVALAVLVRQIAVYYGLPASWSGFVDGMAMVFAVASVAFHARAAKLLNSASPGDSRPPSA